MFTLIKDAEAHPFSDSGASRADAMELALYAWLRACAVHDWPKDDEDDIDPEDQEY